jgi:hypothetical protein
MGFCLVAQPWTYKKIGGHLNCPKIFHGPSQITPAHPSSYFMTGPLGFSLKKMHLMIAVRTLIKESVLIIVIFL